MVRRPIPGVLQSWTLRRLVRRARMIEGCDLYRPAMVFAPHPDDECLGCGGTILKLRKAGQPVQIVIMTDGGRSHHRLMPRDELVALRVQEALDAAKALGVAKIDVHFLGIEDGALARSAGEAREQVLGLLRAASPQQVFLPYRHDPPADHRAANRIVHAALEAFEQRTAVREYPIFAWHQWPMTRRLWPPWAVGRLLRDMSRMVEIGAELDGKRQALACHRSQTTRLRPGVAWATLSDVADGEWLECFFSGYEFFRQPALRWRAP